jgi:hypothetical protein
MPPESKPDARPDAESRTPRRRRLWLLLSVLVAFIIVLRAVLPEVLGWAIESQASQVMGRPIAAENVDLWLLEGGAAIEGVEVGMLGEEPGLDGIADATAILGWSRIYADVDWEAAASGDIAFSQLVIDDPKIQFRLDEEGRLSPLLPPDDPSQPEAEAEEDGDGGGLPTIRVDEMLLRRAKVRVIGPRGELAPVEFILEELVLNGASFVDGSVRVADVSVKAPQFRVRRDFQLAGDPEGVPEETLAADEAPAEPMPLAIDHISVEGADLTVVLADESEFVVAYRLDASEITLDPDTLFPFEFDLDRKGAGKISVHGKAGASPPAFDGSVKWNDVNILSLVGLGSAELAGQMRSGTSTGELEVTARLAPDAGAGLEPGIHLSGSLQAKDFDAGDGQGTTAKFESLEIVVREGFLPPPVDDAAPAPMRFAFERVALTDPVISAVRIESAGAEAPDEESVDAAPEGPAATEAAGESVPPAAPIEIALDRVEIVNGEFAFDDQTLKHPYRTRVKELNLSASDVAWPNPRATDVKASGDLDGEGTFVLTGDFAPRAGDLAFEMNEIALTPFNPYTLQMAGYRIEAGAVSSKTDVEIRGDVIDIDSDFTLHNLAVSEKKAGTFADNFGMPLGVGLALLRDPFGNISLPLPIKIDSEGTNASVKSAIAGALRSAIVGALASPLKIAGGVLAIGANVANAARDQAVKAQPGRAALEPGQDDKLQGLVDLLRARPGLTVDLHGRAGADDRTLVARAMLLEQAAAGEDLPDVAGDNFIARRRAIAVLRKQAAGEAVEVAPGQQVLIDRWVERLEIPTERMNALANARAETLRDELAGRTGIEADRIFISEPLVPERPGIEVEISSREAG